MTFDRITRDPAVQGGRPCVRDTGISVGSILGRLLGGQTRAELLADHPRMVSADIDAVLDFAKQQTRSGELPDVEFGGRILSAADFVVLKVPPDVDARMWELVRREKAAPLPAAEKAEIDDLLRLCHVLSLAKAKSHAFVAAAG